MRRSVTMTTVFVLCLAPLVADVSFTQVTTIEGGAAAMGPASKPVTTVTRIKGTKSRTDIEVMDSKMSSLTDLATKEITLLDHTHRTAHVFRAAGRKGAAPALPVDMSVDVTFRPTGRTRTIDGVACEGHSFRIVIDMADPTGQRMPPQAAEMMKDVKLALDGTVWSSKAGPGAVQYMQFQKAAAEASVSAALAATLGGQRASAGLDKIFAASAAAPGIPCLAEVTTSIVGPGPIADMMRQQMAGMKTVQKTLTVSTDTVPDALFTIPADYKVTR